MKLLSNRKASASEKNLGFIFNGEHSRRKNKIELTKNSLEHHVSDSLLSVAGSRGRSADGDVRVLASAFVAQLSSEVLARRGGAGAGFKLKQIGVLQKGAVIDTDSDQSGALRCEQL